MISKMTKTLILAACLLATGVASAHQREVIVPVAGPGHEHRVLQHGHQAAPRQVVRYQRVAYVPARPKATIHRYAQPARGHLDRSHYKAHARDFGHGRADSRR